jgi:hypothetical protein
MKIELDVTKGDGYLTIKFNAGSHNRMFTESNLDTELAKWLLLMLEIQHRADAEKLRMVPRG